jgi:hypothetical protein
MSFLSCNRLCIITIELMARGAEGDQADIRRTEHSAESSAPPCPTHHLRHLEGTHSVTLSLSLSLISPFYLLTQQQGGDRDGNPYVVASFSNATLLDQKEFVLRKYIAVTRDLIDRLTPSTNRTAAFPFRAAEIPVLGLCAC